VAYLEQNITMRAGNSREIEFTIEDITSLGASTIKWGLSKGAYADKLVEKTNALATEISVSGLVVTVHLDPADTADFPGGRYYHELWAEDTSGYEDTLAVGQVRIYPSLFDS
jgi:hypothetical protein